MPPIYGTTHTALDANAAARVFMLECAVLEAACVKGLRACGLSSRILCPCSGYSTIYTPIVCGWSL